MAMRRWALICTVATRLTQALGFKEGDDFQKHEIEALLMQGAGVAHPTEGPDKAGHRKHHAHNGGKPDEMKLSISDFKFLLLQISAINRMTL